MSNPRIVSIGGGTGQASLLKGLKRFSQNITAVVTVTDSGRSTGVLRKNFDILAPGDLRNCLVSLSQSPKLLQDLFNYRFDKGKDLKGMNFGNLFITALSKIEGSFDKAIKETGKILKIQGKVLPSTLKNVHLKAKLNSGKILKEEVEIVKKTKGDIKKIYLSESANAYKEVISEIKNADLIVLGPGSLYTSVLANLLIKGIPEAIKESKAIKIYVNNIMSQPGQAEGYDAQKHVKEIIKYLGKNILDYVIMNDKKPPKKVLDRYRKTNSTFIECDVKEVEKLGPKVICADVIEEKHEHAREWNKADYIRHDPEKLSNLLIKLLRPKLKGVILVAGKGERMKPFSLNTSKELFRILGKPLIAHHVDEFIKNNINDIVFVCNKKNHDKIKKYFESFYKKQNFEFAIQDEQLGPANALIHAEKHLKNCHFILKYGDSLSENDQIKSILERFHKNPNCDTIITLRKVKNPSEYGIARFNKGAVVEIVEKPEKNPPSDYANVGLCLLKGGPFFKAIKKHGFEKVIPPPQYILLNRGISDYWISHGKRVDVGRVWNILEANKLLIKKLGPSVKSKNIHKSAKIGKNVYIGPKAVIGEDVEIKGYSSVSAHIGKGTMINNSVIQSKANIGKNCNISNSVIDKKVKIGDNFHTRTTSADKIKIFVKDKYVNTDLKRVGCFIAKGANISKNITCYPGKMVYPKRKVNSNIKNDLMVRAILFDADNTLYKTKSISKASDMDAMRFFSRQTKKDEETLYEEWKKIVKKLANEKDIIKRSRKHSYSLLAKKNGLKNVDEAFEKFLKKVYESIEIMPDLLENLPYLKDYKIAVITEDHKELAERKFSKFKLGGMFETLITCNDIGIMKPSKKYFEKALDTLGVTPLESVVVGDSFKKDLEPAKKMGMTTILFGSEDKRADFCIKNYKELIEVLNQL